MEMNNPASRLYGLLVTLSRSDTRQPTSHVLAQVFGVDNSPAALMQAILDFRMLADEIVEYANKRTSYPSSKIEIHIPRIKEVVSISNFDVGWGAYSVRIAADFLIALEILAEITGVEQETIITDESLQEFNVELNKLFELVKRSGALEDEFIVFALKQIELIRRAITEYRISGADGFRSYMDAFYFEMMRQAEVLKKAKDLHPTVFENLKTIIVRASEYSKFASKGLVVVSEMKQLTNDVFGFLGKP